MTYTQEKTITAELIERLTTGESQWRYRSDIKTREAMWENIRTKLEQNNQAVLNGVALTEAEFNQVKEQLAFTSSYHAALFWSGENGVSQVKVVREDATLGTIILKVHDGRAISGGTSSYEIIDEVVTPATFQGERDRRTDVTLCINGLPAVHIELKARHTSYMEAFYQIQKYTREGVFTGVFSSVQMFVVSNGTGTRYIAPASADGLNPTFLTKWANKESQPVEQLLAFADEVLTIPMAHEMITRYTLMNSANQSVLVLRPYQIHAIHAVEEAMKRQQSGYVWHTTGSGKTITSYKVAQTLLKIPAMDKVIFLVDRRDLDQQTTRGFKAYAEHEALDIEETDNVLSLAKALTSDRRDVIITTRQKLQRLRQRLATGQGKWATYQKKLHGLQVAFVVDECHRTVSPKEQRSLKYLFPRALWYGFTGTPIYEESGRESEGDLPVTTDEMYGACLHQYTIKEAIHDKTVLGFHVEYVDTLSDKQLDEIVASIYRQRGMDKADALTGVKILPRVEKEQMMKKHKAFLPADGDDDNKHMIEVVQTIVARSANKLGLSQPSGQAFSGILTVSSIQQAIRYYRLFRTLGQPGSAVTVPDDVKKRLTHFPRVAVTFSVDENSEQSDEVHLAITEALQHYNDLFGTSFRYDALQAYNQNLNERLARTDARYQSRKEQLDLVIVVDRLLTGFDAPPVSTLFVDRPPMRPHDIIQAFSRTNRLLRAQKAYGHIVIFGYTEWFKQAVDEAIVLYSAGGSTEVLAPDYADALATFKQAVKYLREVLADPLDDEAVSEADDAALIDSFFRFDKAFRDILMYEKTEQQLRQDPFLFEREYGLSQPVLEAYEGAYHNARARQAKASDDDAIDIVADFGYESRYTIRIDYAYILQLIKGLLPDDPGEVVVVDEAKEEEITSLIASIGEGSGADTSLSEVLYELWLDIKKHPGRYVGVNMDRSLHQYISRTLEKRLESLSEGYGLPLDTVVYVMEQHGQTVGSGDSLLLEHFIDQANGSNRLVKRRQAKEQVDAFLTQLGTEIIPLKHVQDGL